MKARFPALLITLVLSIGLNGCVQPEVLATRTVQQQNNQSTQTQAAIFVLTEIAQPPRTPTPSPTQPEPSTSTATQIPPEVSATATRPSASVTPLAGLVMVAHPDISDYLFQVDLALWEIDPSGKTADLVSKIAANCRIESVLGQGLGQPQRILWQDLGRFRWEVMDYGSWAFAYPIRGVGLSENQNSFLRLQGYNRQVCRTRQEQILANLMTRREAEGEVQFAVYQSPTPRPALEDFQCPETPPTRLRAGDQVAITTTSLWLRSEPRADNSTRVRQYPRNTPYIIRVIGKPVCEKYVFSQVEVVEFGEGGAVTQGWMAEGDPQEYYLAPVK